MSNSFTSWSEDHPSVHFLHPHPPSRWTSRQNIAWPQEENLTSIIIITNGLLGGLKPVTFLLTSLTSVRGRKKNVFPLVFSFIISPLPVQLIPAVNSQTLLLSFHLGLLTAVTHGAVEQTQAVNKTAHVSKSVFIFFLSFRFPGRDLGLLGLDVLVRRKSCRNFAGCLKPPESLESGLSLQSQPTGEQSGSD